MLVLDKKYKEFEGSVVPCMAVAPGSILADELEARDISLVDFAIMTHLSLEALQDYVSGKISVTEEMTEKFEKALGIEASFWLKCQRHYEYDLLMLSEKNRQKKETQEPELCVV